MKFYSYMNKIFSSIGIVVLIKELTQLINWINKKTETKLYEPESLNHLDKAETYLKKYY